MGRSPCCDKAKVKRGPWSPEEDSILKNYLHTYGTGGNWIALPLKAGLKRCGKSCRLRWLNYLRPDIKHGGFTEEEDRIILTLYSKIGRRWSVIASHLQGRTDNDIKNYWNTKMKKKLMATKSSMAINSESSNYGEYPYMTNSQDNEMIPYVGETNIQENVTNCCSDYNVTLQNSQQMAVPALYTPILSQEKSGTSNYGFWPAGNRVCEDDKIMFEQSASGSSCPTIAANIEGDLLDGIDFLEEIKATNYEVLGSSDLVQDEQFYYQSFANLLSKQV